MFPKILTLRDINKWKMTQYIKNQQVKCDNHFDFLC